MKLIIEQVYYHSTSETVHTVLNRTSSWNWRVCNPSWCGYYFTSLFLKARQNRERKHCLLERATNYMSHVSSYTSDRCLVLFFTVTAYIPIHSVPLLLLFDTPKHSRPFAHHYCNHAKHNTLCKKFGGALDLWKKFLWKLFLWSILDAKISRSTVFCLETTNCKYQCNERCIFQCCAVARRWPW